MYQLSELVQSAIKVNAQHERDIVTLRNLTGCDYRKCQKMLAEHSIGYWETMLNNEFLGK